MPERYEVRDYTVGKSRKKFHVWDRKDGLEVFHTNSRERAEELVDHAGSETITQHLKDRGHHPTHGEAEPCLTCAGTK